MEEMPDARVDTACPDTVVNAQQLAARQLVQLGSFVNVFTVYKHTYVDPRRITDPIVLVMMHVTAVIVYQDSAANAQQPVARLRVQVENSVSK